MFDEIIAKMEVAIEMMVALIKQQYVFSCAISGGKDSTAILIITLEAIRRVAREGYPQGEHYIVTADTTIENSAMRAHAEHVLTEVEDHAAANGLPISVHIATPTLASQFVVSTIGRGTLIRTVENSVKDGKKKRACSQAWKVQPQDRLRARLEGEASARGVKEIITVLGTRFSESKSRATSMTERGENAIRPVRNASGSLTLSPICDFDLEDVWMVAALFTNDAAPFASPVSRRTIERMTDLYRAGNEGTCGVVVGDGGNRAACGSRFGCAFCCISGEKDKSMASMIKEPEHAYMQGLNRFRDYLLKTQWDLTRRELVGRSLSEAGYIRVQPDVLSFQERITLLKYLLTLDAVERERAEQMEDDLATGKVADTPANRELCGVQFEMVTPTQLVAIDFQLSMHHYAPHAFPALSVWHDVHVLGRRYPVPEVEMFPKVSITHHGWVYVGQFDAQAPVDGLRDYGAEQWNPYRHGERVSTYAQTSKGERVVYFEESDTLEVDAVAACTFVTCTFDTQFMLRAQAFTGMESARFWLNEAILRLPQGMSQRYQEMAKRGQYFARLAERFNLSPQELDQYLIEAAISDREHAALLGETALDLPQTDLFPELLKVA